MMHKILLVEISDAYGVADIPAQEKQKLEHLRSDLLFKLNQ